MIKSHVTIQGSIFCTSDGARALARQNGWQRRDGASLTLRTIMGKIAGEAERKHAYLMRADDGVVCFFRKLHNEGKVATMSWKPGSAVASARWSDFQAANRVSA